MKSNFRFRVASLLFFASGFASLIYQVSWQKKIFTLLGSDVFATSMVVSAFMLGLALGSLAVGRVVDRLRRPVALYGVLETLIGLYALSFPLIIARVQPLLHGLYRTQLAGRPLLYLATKFSLLFLVLLPPTILMGATLPLMVQAFSRQQHRPLKDVVGWFYSLNTFGAFCGVLLSGFLLIRLLGLRTTLLIAILTSIGTGLTAILLQFQKQGEELPKKERGQEGPVPELPPSPGHRWIIFSAFFVGLAMMALEVVWTRMLVQYFSATVYSFAIVLLFVLLGIFWGAQRARRLKAEDDRLLTVYLSLLTGLGLYIAACGLLFNFSSALFTRLVFVLLAIFKAKTSWFAITLFAKMLVSALFILVPCILSGMLFPIATQLYNRESSAAGRTTSRLYLANTIGSVIGPLAAAFLLIPLMGIRPSLAAIALSLVFIALLMAAALHTRRTRTVLFALLVAIVLTVLTGLQPKKIFANYTMVSPKTKILFHEEGFYQTISLLRNEKGESIFMIDGNVEADTHPIQLRQFVLKSHLPFLLAKDGADVLVIGLGMGITLHALETNPWVRDIDVVELSPEVVKAQAKLKAINGDVLSFPRLRVITDDGRNYLAATSRKYGVITIDPIHPRISGVGTLYTREFYQLVKSRLTPDGIFVQWMPSYQMSAPLFRVAVNSFYSAFPRSFLWYSKGHFLMVGHAGELRLDYPQVKARFAQIEKDMAAIGVPTVEDFLSLVAMPPAAIEAYAHTAPAINSDDNLFLEYAAPGDYLYRVEDIIRDALPYFTFPSEFIANSSPEEMQALQERWQKRRDYILEEAAQPIR